MKKHSREGVITHKFVEMMKLMNIYLNHFPKHEKQALCAQIKKTTLTQIDVMHEQLRMLTYLSYELGYFRFGAGEQLATGAEETEGHRYMAISRLIDELGKMIGAWIVSAKEKGEW
jgi:hypothetical protein